MNTTRLVILRQLSVFVENRSGRIAVLCRTLADAGINLNTLNVAEAGQFGLLRLITPDPDKTQAVLEQNGYAVKVTNVVALLVPDRPGGLAFVLETVAKVGIEVEYMYAFARNKGSDAAMIFSFDNLLGAVPILNKAGISVLAQDELFG